MSGSLPVGSQWCVVWQTQGQMDGCIFFPINLCVKLKRQFNSSVLSYPFLFVFLWPVLKTAQTFLPSSNGKHMWTWSRREGSQPSVGAIQAQPSLPWEQVMLQKCWWKPRNTSYQFILLPKAQWLKDGVSIWSLLQQDTCEIITELMTDNSSHTTSLRQGWILST